MMLLFKPWLHLTCNKSQDNKNNLIILVIDSIYVGAYA